MSYPQRPSLVGLVLGIVGILQIFLGVMFALQYFEYFDIFVLLEDSELMGNVLFAIVSNLAYIMDPSIILGVAISLFINGCMYIAFYVILNNVKQTNAMVKKMYTRMNR